jgi:SHAQKYF class myb-like DNA-binding protein
MTDRLLVLDKKEVRFRYSLVVFVLPAPCLAQLLHVLSPSSLTDTCPCPYCAIKRKISAMTRDGTSCGDDWSDITKSDEGYAASSKSHSSSGSNERSSVASQSNSNRTKTSSMSSSVLMDFSSAVNKDGSIRLNSLSRSDSPRSSCTSLSSNGETHMHVDHKDVDNDDNGQQSATLWDPNDSDSNSSATANLPKGYVSSEGWLASSRSSRSSSSSSSDSGVGRGLKRVATTSSSQTKRKRLPADATAMDPHSLPLEKDDDEDENEEENEDKNKEDDDKDDRIGGCYYWTDVEHAQFKQGVITHGWGDWLSISRNFVSSRNNKQIRSHAQAFRKKHQDLYQQLLHEHSAHREHSVLVP